MARVATKNLKLNHKVKSAVNKLKARVLAKNSSFSNKNKNKYFSTINATQCNYS